MFWLGLNLFIILYVMFAPTILVSLATIEPINSLSLNFLSNKLKLEFGNIAQELIDLGFKFIATKGTASHLRKKNIESEVIWRISDRKQPDILSVMRKGDVDLIINLPTGRRAATDGAQMRRLAVELGIPFITTLTGAKAAIDSLKEGESNYLEPLKKIKY